MISARLVGLGATLLLVSLPALSQNIVSARAGLIHYSDGRVLLNEKPIVHKATQFQEVKENEYLRTERGRAEVLLTPGIFLRLGEDSQIQMISSRLTDVRFRLLSGAAVIEADEIDKGSSVTVTVGDLQVHLLRNGLYRLDADEEAPRLRVFAGEALVKAGTAEYHVKSKKEIELAGDYGITRFDPEDTDALDRWSKRRANYLAVANVSASRMAYNNGLVYGSSRWIWNPYYSMYTFLPYRGVCWSPYGFGFYSPGSVYVLYNPPRPNYGSSGFGPSGPTYNASYGYSTMGTTSAGTSGVIASRNSGGMGGMSGSGGSVGASSGGAASSGGISRGTSAGGGGGTGRR